MCECAVINQDSTYKVAIDGNEAVRSSLSSSTNFEPPLNPPAQIVDPKDRKPSDWIDDPEVIGCYCPFNHSSNAASLQMDDPTDSKPDDWDESQPLQITDTSATKPADWDENAPEVIPDPEAVKPEVFHCTNLL